MRIRDRPAGTGRTALPVHLVPMPDRPGAGAVSTLCGALLRLEAIEAVTPGQGVPCAACLVNQVTVTTLPVEPPTGSAGDGLVAAVAYREWGWPVTQHRDQIRLSLHRDASAIAIPIPISAGVTQVLTERHCAPAVLSHPYAPEHRIVLTGERFGAGLPWPASVHEVIGVLMLPPTVTPRGPVAWIQPPLEDSLRLSREIDVFGALRTVLSSSVPGADPGPGQHQAPS
jgi:hypothetical protein